MELMQKQIEELTMYKQILETEKGQNLVSIEEIASDNNNYKVLLSELRKINIGIKEDKKQLLSKNSSIQIKHDELQGKAKMDHMEYHCQKDKIDLDLLRFKTENEKQYLKIDELTKDKVRKDTEISSIKDSVYEEQTRQNEKWMDDKISLSLDNKELKATISALEKKIEEFKSKSEGLAEKASKLENELRRLQSEQDSEFKSNCQNLRQEIENITHTLSELRDDNNNLKTNKVTNENQIMLLTNSYQELQFVKKYLLKELEKYTRGTFNVENFEMNVNKLQSSSKVSEMETDHKGDKFSFNYNDINSNRDPLSLGPNDQNSNFYVSLNENRDSVSNDHTTNSFKKVKFYKNSDNVHNSNEFYGAYDFNQSNVKYGKDLSREFNDFSLRDNNYINQNSNNKKKTPSKFQRSAENVSENMTKDHIVKLDNDITPKPSKKTSNYKQNEVDSTNHNVKSNLFPCDNDKSNKYFLGDDFKKMKQYQLLEVISIKIQEIEKADMESEKNRKKIMTINVEYEKVTQDLSITKKNCSEQQINIDELKGTISEQQLQIRNLKEDLSCNLQELEFAKGRISTLEEQLRSETKKAIDLDGRVDELNLNMEHDDINNRDQIESLSNRVVTLTEENSNLSKILEDVSKDKEIKVNIERKIQIENRKKIAELDGERENLTLLTDNLKKQLSTLKAKLMEKQLRYKDNDDVKDITVRRLTKELNAQDSQRTKLYQEREQIKKEMYLMKNFVTELMCEMKLEWSKDVKKMIKIKTRYQDFLKYEANVIPKSKESDEKLVNYDKISSKNPQSNFKKKSNNLKHEKHPVQIKSPLVSREDSSMEKHNKQHYMKSHKQPKNYEKFERLATDEIPKNESALYNYYDGFKDNYTTDIAPDAQTACENRISKVGVIDIESMYDHQYSNNKKITNKKHKNLNQTDKEVELSYINQRRREKKELYEANQKKNLLDLYEAEQHGKHFDDQSYNPCNSINKTDAPTKNKDFIDYENYTDPNITKDYISYSIKSTFNDRNFIPKNRQNHREIYESSNEKENAYNNNCLSKSNTKLKNKENTNPYDNLDRYNNFSAKTNPRVPKNKHYYNNSRGSGQLNHSQIDNLRTTANSHFKYEGKNFITKIIDVSNQTSIQEKSIRNHQRFNEKVQLHQRQNNPSDLSRSRSRDSKTHKHSVSRSPNSQMISQISSDRK